MKMGKRTEAVVRALAMVAAAGAVTAVATSAEARWRGAATCLKAIGERTRTGDEFAWGLNCTAAGSGNYQVVHSHQHLTATDWYWEWPQDSNGAAGTSVTVRDGTPWVVSADHSVWWKQSPAGGTPDTGGSWFSYPTNKCEGGTLTIRQVVGDTSIAVGDANYVYVIGGNGQVRTWNGSCWAQLPTFASGTAREIAIWGGWPAGQRYRPWVVLNNNEFWYLTAADVWKKLVGSGVAISQGVCVDTGGATRWNWVAPTWRQDTTWTGGAMNQITPAWIIAANGTGYHWE